MKLVAKFGELFYYNDVKNRQAHELIRENFDAVFLVGRKLL